MPRAFPRPIGHFFAYKVRGSWLGEWVERAIASQPNTIGAGLDTLFAIEGLFGSNLGDTLSGSAGANLLAGGSGRDRPDGRGGDDRLDGKDGEVSPYSFDGTLRLSLIEEMRSGLHIGQAGSWAWAM